RRRHTRSKRDWSSDVCSSDLFKKVHLEMGGKNVIMIMDDAQLDLAVEGCLWGGFGTSGQRCTAAQPRRRSRERLQTVSGAVRREIGRASCRKEGRWRGWREME